MGRKYLIPAYLAAKAAAADFVQITAHTNRPTRILGIHVEQHTDYGDAQAEGIELQLARFTTGGGIGTGAALTPPPHSPTDTAYGGTVHAAVGGALTAAATLTTLIEGGMNVQAGWHWTPHPDAAIEITGGGKVVLRPVLPANYADAIDFEITIEIEEIG